MLNSNRFLHQRPEQSRLTRGLNKSTWKPSHRSFQLKYTGFLIAAVFGAVALFMGVAFYQLHENYEIFKQLAFDTNPQLVSHLEREMTQFNLFFISTLASVFTFCLVLGLRFTANVIRPLIQLERHMKKVTSGDWSSPDFVYRNDEDLVDLLDTYSYLYRSLRAHTEAEIKMLENLAIDPHNREAQAIWRTLVQQKRLQLNLMAKPQPIVSPVSEIVPSPASRRAS